MWEGSGAMKREVFAVSIIFPHEQHQKLELGVRGSLHFTVRKIPKESAILATTYILFTLKIPPGESSIYLRILLSGLLTVLYPINILIISNARDAIRSKT